MRVSRSWFLLAVMFCFVGVAVEVRAVDDDANGLQDDFELQLARQFAPSFTFHSGNPLEPKPVEIMMHSPSSNRLRIQDVYRESYTPDLYYEYMGPYCGYYPQHCGSEILHFLEHRRGIYNGIWHNNLEFGVPGDEDEGVWRNKYLNGGDGLLLPGVDMPAKIYAHLFEDSGTIVIQYWFFYRRFNS